MVRVTAAVIESGGRVLICRRRGDQSHPGKWEFPGGKVEDGESPAEALARELEEELGCRARVGDEITRFRYQYPGKEPIELIFFRAEAPAGEVQNREFAEIAWAAVERLPEFDFLEGDIEFVRQLAAGGFSSSRG